VQVFLVESFLLDFPPKRVCILLLPIRATCLNHLILFDFVSLIVFGEESSMYNLLHPLIVSSAYEMVHSLTVFWQDWSRGYAFWAKVKKSYTLNKTLLGLLRKKMSLTEHEPWCSYIVLVAKSGGKTPYGRHRRKWKHCIRLDLINYVIGKWPRIGRSGGLLWIW
jgi:hypothetical protein